MLDFMLDKPDLERDSCFRPLFAALEESSHCPHSINVSAT